MASPKKVSYYCIVDNNQFPVIFQQHTQIAVVKKCGYNEVHLATKNKNERQTTNKHIFLSLNPVAQEKLSQFLNVQVNPMHWTCICSHNSHSLA